MGIRLQISYLKGRKAGSIGRQKKNKDGNLLIPNLGDQLNNVRFDPIEVEAVKMMPLEELLVDI